MLEEFIRKTNLAQSGIDLCGTKVLANTSTNSTDSNTIFDCYNQPVIGSHFYN
jgi:hypothetical protein